MYHEHIGEGWKIEEALMRELRGVVQRLKRTGPTTEPWGTLKVRYDGEMCGGIATADERDERYEVKQRKCRTRWKDDGVGWSGREYQRQQIDQEKKCKRLVA